MRKKYELTEDKKVFNERTLYRIKALRDFADVKAGDFGGWIEKEKNLSHNGDAWVYGDARVCGKAWVFGDARVCDKARVCGDARVFGDAWVFGDARVCDKAMVCGKAMVDGTEQKDGAK